MNTKADLPLSIFARSRERISRPKDKMPKALFCRAKHHVLRLTWRREYKIKDAPQIFLYGIVHCYEIVIY